MANENSYEEARKQRVQENLKQLEGLGISKISKTLSEVTKCEYKLLKCRTSPKSMKNIESFELRRSSRARNPISLYYGEVDDIDRPSRRKRYNLQSYSGRNYFGRIASYKEQVRAVERAEELERGLKSSNPSFIKSMVRSHVSSCFWLGLPSKFCQEHLPPRELKMVLEDEKGSEFDVIYIGSRTGLSGGWKGFAVDHNLEDGDALVFELSEPARFKVYIIKASEQPNQVNVDKVANVEVKGHTKSERKKSNSTEDDVSVRQEPHTSTTRAERAAKRRLG